MELRLWYQSPVGTLSGSGDLVVALLRCLWRMRRTPDHHTASRLVQELTRGVPSMTRKQVSQREATELKGTSLSMGERGPPARALRV